METTTLTAWQRVLADSHLRDLPYKVETNEYDQILLSPHRNKHSFQQLQIADLMRDHAKAAGRRAVEFAVETRKGVKVPDVVWLSAAQAEALPDDADACPFAPAVCVEVLSRANTQAEMAEKRQLYFEAGASEVWLCAEDGRMRFYQASQPEPIVRSALFPGFPTHLNE